MVVLLGQNIKKVRKNWRFGQIEFGEIFNSTRPTLSSYENNNSKPDIFFLVKLQQLSHVNAYDLLFTEIDESIISNAPDFDNKVPVAALAGQAKKSLNDRVEELEDQVKAIQDFLTPEHAGTK